MSAESARRRRDGRLARTAALAVALLAGGAAQGQQRATPPTGPTTVAPVAIPVTPAPPAAQDAARPQVVPSEPEKVHVRRLADVVAVREGPRAGERVLYYFNPDLLLSQSDHVEQGSGGQSELTWPGGAVVQLHSNAHIELSLLSAEGDVVRVPLVTRLEAAVLDRPLDLILPGGTQVHLANTTLRVEVEPGRLGVRNTGDKPVTLHGDLRLHRTADDAEATGELVLKGGEEVIIPLFRGAGDETGTITDLWGLLTVRHHRGLHLQPDGDRLRLQRATSGDDAAPAAPPAAGAAAGPAAPPEEASIGGVTTRWMPGSTLVVRNPRHVEPPQAPPAVAPPAAAPAPSSPATPAEGTPAPAADEPPQPAPPGEASSPKDPPPSPRQPSGAARHTAGKESRS